MLCFSAASTGINKKLCAGPSKDLLTNFGVLSVSRSFRKFLAGFHCFSPRKIALDQVDYKLMRLESLHKVVQYYPIVLR